MPLNVRRDSHSVVVRNVFFLPPPIPLRLVQEELSVAKRRFGVLINSHDGVTADVLIVSGDQIGDAETGIQYPQNGNSWPPLCDLIENKSGLVRFPCPEGETIIDTSHKKGNTNDKSVRHNAIAFSISSFGIETPISCAIGSSRESR